MILIGVPGLYLAYKTAFPSQTKSISVELGFLGEASMVLGPNGSVKAGGVPFFNPVFQGYITHVYVTVINNGTAPVFLRQIVMTTNSTGGTSITAISGDLAAIAPGQSQTYPVNVDASNWQPGNVAAKFTVSGDGVSRTANMVLNVLPYQQIP